jgi:hypothetical protein
LQRWDEISPNNGWFLYNLRNSTSTSNPNTFFKILSAPFNAFSSPPWISNFIKSGFLILKLSNFLAEIFILFITSNLFESGKRSVNCASGENVDETWGFLQRFKFIVLLLLDIACGNKV